MRTAWRFHDSRRLARPVRVTILPRKITDDVMIQVTPSIAIDESELHEDFMRASGAGGQNIQKVETAVQLRFDVANSPNLPAPVRSRLGTLAGRRMTKAGVLIISAQRHRTQERNRADALERLLALIREAAAPPPPPRRKTRPTLGSKQRRLDGKKLRSAPDLS